MSDIICVLSKSSGKIFRVKKGFFITRLMGELISGLCGRLMCCLACEDETLGRLYAEEKVEED